MHLTPRPHKPKWIWVNSPLSYNDKFKFRRCAICGRVK